MKTAWAILIIIVVGLALLTPALTYASNLGVWPINPRIDAPASSSLIWVKNSRSTEPITLQARIFSWKQSDGADHTEPQDELVVSPPIVEVKPGAQQVFRIMNRQGVVDNVEHEKSYRLIIDEVPQKNKAPTSSLQFQMRYSLPLFVGMPSDLRNFSMNERLKTMAPQMRYRVIKETSSLQITNQSPIHARISQLSASSASAPKRQVAIADGLLGYVLPNSSRRWPLTKQQLAALTQPDTTLTFIQEHQELSIAREE
jgi:fimbrial chaperone protein